MRAFTLTIDTDNAAFTCDDNTPFEVARILSHLAGRLRREGRLEVGDEFTLLDINGNKVGMARQTRKELA